MSSFEQLKHTFFDECSDLLQQIETSLTEIREGNSTEDTINAVFRAVHSIKGGAGIFGFETLVRFAHVFETVMDAIRSDRLAITPDNIDTLLAAGDVLADLVNMSRSDEGPTADYGSECRAALEEIMRENGDGDEVGGSDVATDFDDIDFIPVMVGDDIAMLEAGPAEQGFTIVFRPRSDLLKKGNEPLHILRELRQLGELELTADTAGLPALAEMEFDQPYVAWTGRLRTSAARADVEAVFDFVSGDCDLEINDLTSLPPNELIVETASVMSAAAPATSVLEAPSIADAPRPAPSSAQTSAPSPASRPVEAAKPAAPIMQIKSDEPAGEAKVPAAKAAVTTTRVELEKIDRVVNMVGELVIAQAMLGQIVQELPEHVMGRLMQTLDEVVHHTRELKDSVMSIRAQPVGAVFQRMPRLVRELSVKTAKKVRLEMSGENTEVDRSIIERLADPLTHIIRNSMDHGIESPADRIAAGKPEEGTIRLGAEHRGGKIVIEVRDDGAGINPERVLKKARERGLISADATLSDDEINNLIFLPGFSTAEAISDISGRGVGMDVVRRNIQDIGGRISLKSERGRGMTLQLALPLTLAVMDGMVIRVGRETYVVPMSAMVECLRPPRGDIHDLVGTRGMLKLRGDLLPIVNLGDLLDVNSNADDSGGVVIITEAGEDIRFGLRVDELLGHQQVVIKSIEESYGAIPGIAAATILGNGRVAFILDTEKLYEMAAIPPSTSQFATKSAAPIAA
jgi:two-component system chemotaxis sensor kinase CheA